MFSYLECLNIIKICSSEDIEGIRQCMLSMGGYLFNYFILTRGVGVYIFKFDQEYLVTVSSTSKEIEDIDLGNWTRNLKDSNDKRILYKKNKLHVSSAFNNHYSLILKRFEDAIKEILDERKFYPTNFQFIGYGFCSGLATLLCFEMSRRFFSILPNLTTFGSPKIGNKNFSAAFRHFVPSSNRIVLKNDPMPNTPSLLYGFKHINKSLYLDKNGKVIKRPRITTKKKNHNIDLYIEVIQKYIENDLKIWKNENIGKNKKIRNEITEFCM